ncbi:2555_t:CDS:10, partial [Scutellospora calospora]
PRIMDSPDIVDIGLADLSWAKFLKSRALYSITSSNVTHRLEPSRLAILNILKELNNWNSELFLNSFVPMVVKEADKLNQKSLDCTTYTTSSAIRFVLLTWVNILINFVLSATTNAESSPHWKSLVDAQAILLHSLVHESEKRRSVTNSALVGVRHCIRKNALHIPSYIKYLSSNMRQCDAVLLGTVVDCSLRLKKENGKTFVENAKNEIIQFYITSIASSKTPVPQTSKDALRDFIKYIITEDDFQTKLIPVFEKLLLRAPEIVLSVVQNDAIILLNILIEKSRNDDILVDIVKDILQALSGGTAKVANPEHRFILFRTLSHIYQTPNLSKTVIEGLLPIILKESHEYSLAKAIDTLGLHLKLLLKTEDQILIEKVTGFIIEGLASAKTGERKAWATVIGRLAWEETGYPSVSLRNVILKSLVPLMSTVEKIQANALNFIGGPIEGYILVAIVEGRAKCWNDDEINELIRARKFKQNILATSPKLSFLFWDKIYSKLATIDESSWFIRSLESIILNQDDDGSLQKEDIKVYIATAFIYMISTSRQACREAYDTLKTCLQTNPNFVGEIVRKGLTNWVFNLEKNVKDSTAVLASATAHADPAVNAYRLSKVLTAITTFTEKVDISEVEKSLVELI